MELNRKPFQGLTNVIRFNWHFYAFSLFSLITLFLIREMYSPLMQFIITSLILIIAFIILFSLIVSFYVYDLSNLYKMEWLKGRKGGTVLNVNAGFDEVSKLIMKIMGQVELINCDFYDPTKHTEVSIKRARKAYPPDPRSISVTTGKLPFDNESFDVLIAFLSVHEIRDSNERANFFKELNRVLKPSGEIIVTEHLRDFNNFLAYNIGFFHFHSKRTWLDTFKSTGLFVNEEVRTSGFITTYILKKNGDTP